MSVVYSQRLIFRLVYGQMGKRIPVRIGDIHAHVRQIVDPFADETGRNAARDSPELDKIALVFFDHAV